MLLTSVAQLNPSGTSNGRKRIVVIGAGAVGLYAATELVKRDPMCEVVVIEAGERHLGSFAADSYRCVGLPSDGLRIGRSRSLGGTTNLWGGQLVEFQPVDFAGREWMPHSKWPVEYSEIAPYYAKTYESLGIEGDKQIDDTVWRSVSTERPRLDASDESGKPVGVEAFLTRWLKIPNFAVYYDKQIQTDERLLVLTGHTAVGFRGESDGQITGVRVRDNGGVEQRIPGDVFILAAGTVENSRLLLHSASDATWACPWRGNSNVGAYFLDHLGGPIATVQPNDKRVFFGTFCTIAKGGHKYQPKIRLTNETLVRDRILNIHAACAFESSASEHLVYLKQFLKAALYSRKISGVGDLIRNATGTVRYLVPLMWRYVWDHRVFVPSTAKVALVIQGEQVPCAESRIRIDAGELDGHGLPRVVLDWRLAGSAESAGAEELASIHSFAMRADQALRAAGLAKLQIDEDLLAMNPRFLKSLKDTIHQSGGTVMGWSEADGVVDRNLRVFGTKNLYVGGSSVFRTVGNANVTLTALAFATRLSEHLTSLKSRAS